MSSIDKRLYLKLFTAFIAATIIGTVSHEFGHYLVAKHFGYHATINYAYTFWTPANQNEIVSAEKNFYITLGGPLQTMLTGTIGIILLLLFRSKYNPFRELTFGQWTIIFISLFWLRQTANLVTWHGGAIITGEYSTHGDELNIANYLRLPPWTITTATAIIGVIVLLTVVFKFVPMKQRLTFLTAGLTGGIAGYILWIVLLGKYIMP